MKNGDFVRINYIGRLETGEVFDLTDPEVAKKEKIFNPKISYKPVPIIIGEHFVLPGLEKALLEMNVGENKIVDISAEDGFGKRDPKLVQIVPQKAFKDINIRPGLIVDFGYARGRIQSVDAGRVRVDFNHPLAGKNLKYVVGVIEKIDDRDGKVKAIMEFFGIDHNFDVKEKELTIEVTLPSELKRKISDIVVKHMPEIEKVKFVEIFEKIQKERKA